MANLYLASIPDGLAALCVGAALTIGMLFGIFLLCVLQIGADHGPRR